MNQLFNQFLRSLKVAFIDPFLILMSAPVQ